MRNEFVPYFPKLSSSVQAKLDSLLEQGLIPAHNGSMTAVLSDGD
jgi:hypothetical protein